MPSFTELPTELLQLIAGRCPATDILALSKTCRRLKEACDTAAVFRMSFEYQLPELTSTAFKDKSALVRFMDTYVDGPQKPCQRNEGPKMTWLCLAVAVARLPGTLADLQRLVEPIASNVQIRGSLTLAIRKPPQLNDDTKGSLRGLVAFLSTLPIWGYTAACDAYVSAILDSLSVCLFSLSGDLKALRIDQAIGEEHPLQFAFCLVLSKLEAWRLSKARDSNSELLRTDGYLSIIKRNYDGVTLGQGYDKFQGSWIGRQTHALLLIELIARNVYYASEELPNPRKIEFLGSWYFECVNSQDEHVEHGAWMEAGSLRPRFPLLTPSLIAPPGKGGRYFYPFSGDGWWSWYTTRVRDLARRLDEGEWYGAFMYSLLPGTPVGPSMTLRFHRTSDGGGDAYSIEAPDGVDENGSFSLRGEVNASPAACTVRLRKQYSSITVDLDGLITPLGICGGCYTARPWPLERRAVEYFWLWKREWMDSMVTYLGN